MRFPPQLVSVLCTLQSLFIVMAWMVVGGFRKAYAISTVGWENAPVFPLGARMFYYGGPLLLLVPLIWGYVATTRAETGQGFVVLSEKQGWIGWAVTGAVVLMCLYAAGLAFAGLLGPHAQF